MQLKHNGVTFYVSTVKGSRDEKNRDYYCVNIEFKDVADIEKHAIAHAIWGAQQKVRFSKDVAAGLIKKVPKNFTPYRLVPVYHGKLADGQTFKPNASINSDAVIQEDLSEKIAQLTKVNELVFTAAIDQNPEEARERIKAEMERMMALLAKADEAIAAQTSEEDTEDYTENNE